LELSADEHWARYSRKVRWLAARFYAGVDSLSDLSAMLPPAIVQMIFSLR
jgi:hypothetical protein